MSSKRILLIDQYRGIETRMAVVEDGVLQDFDHENLCHKLKKGNIYLAKVMRVEPSLQAAFLDFGEERHGFLPFSDIHPVYYQIEGGSQEEGVTVKEDMTEVISEETAENDPASSDPQDDKAFQKPSRGKNTPYKIQDVIKKNQVMMVQVVKDTRSTKGAALTTYISLPGRYSVLMPNTPKGNGISRKITASEDRERIKEIVSSLDVPPEMSVVIRTAGLNRRKTEIKRDYDYLMRLWSTFSSVSHEAPALLYEEQDLVVRALRDFYDTDTEEILIQGKPAFQKARSFMRMLMPRHARRVTLYEDDQPLFEKWAIEPQIADIYRQIVTLPSGGSLVINSTEALVAIDVNSGRATQAKHIDDTAIKTNLEAAQAIARHLRLRDLSGLIIIDFIDMAPAKRPQVERALKEALKSDRARIQVGTISGFGLLEMSRQRLRQSLLESQTTLCSHCQGSGRVFSFGAMAVQHLRKIEAMARAEKKNLVVSGPSEVIFYLLNEHRHLIQSIEQDTHIQLRLMPDAAVPASEILIREVPNKKEETFEKERSHSEKKRKGAEGRSATGMSEDKKSAASPESDVGKKVSRKSRHKPKIQSASEPSLASVVADEISQESVTEALEGSALVGSEAPKRNGRRRRTVRNSHVKHTQLSSDEPTPHASQELKKPASEKDLGSDKKNMMHKSPPRSSHSKAPKGPPESEPDGTLSSPVSAKIRSVVPDSTDGGGHIILLPAKKKKWGRRSASK